MAKFVLLLRDRGMWAGDMSPEEMQKVIGRYREWIGGIKGKGEKLRDGEGRVVSPKFNVTDGPYVETKMRVSVATICPERWRNRWSISV